MSRPDCYLCGDEFFAQAHPDHLQERQVAALERIAAALEKPDDSTDRMLTFLSAYRRPQKEGQQ